MATTWTKEADQTSDWVDSDYGLSVLTEDLKELLQEDELHNLASEGIVIVWSDINDQSSSWSKVTDESVVWTEVADKVSSWSKVTDESVVWTKNADIVSDWDSGELGEWIQTEDLRDILEEDGIHTLAQEGLVTTWSGVIDIVSDWVSSGVGLKLATEGLRTWLWMEGDKAGIVLSKTGVWTDTADQSTSWTKVGDA